MWSKQIIFINRLDFMLLRKKAEIFYPANSLPLPQLFYTSSMLMKTMVRCFAWAINCWYCNTHSCCRSHCVGWLCLWWLEGLLLLWSGRHEQYDFWVPVGWNQGGPQTLCVACWSSSSGKALLYHYCVLHTISRVPSSLTLQTPICMLIISITSLFYIVVSARLVIYTFLSSSRTPQKRIW